MERKALWTPAGFWRPRSRPVGRGTGGGLAEGLPCLACSLARPSPGLPGRTLVVTPPAMGSRQQGPKFGCVIRRFCNRKGLRHAWLTRSRPDWTRSKPQVGPNSCVLVDITAMQPLPRDPKPGRVSSPPCRGVPGGRTPNASASESPSFFGCPPGRSVPVRGEFHRMVRGSASHRSGPASRAPGAGERGRAEAARGGPDLGLLLLRQIGVLPPILRGQAEPHAERRRQR